MSELFAGIDENVNVNVNASLNENVNLNKTEIENISQNNLIKTIDYNIAGNADRSLTNQNLS